jgi:hypothetical protein
LTYNYRRLSEMHRTADRAMTDFKQRAHSLKTDVRRYDEDAHIKLLSYESQTNFELDGESRDFGAAVADEFKVKTSLETQARDLIAQISSLRREIAQTAARVEYLEDFCGTRKFLH